MYLKKINLKNKYALVTGAGKGLGRACSIAMAEAGATIIGLSRTSSDLDKLEKDIKKVKSKLIKINCDVMDYKDLSKKLHPDRGGSEDEFIELSEMYESKDILGMYIKAEELGVEINEGNIEDIEQKFQESCNILTEQAEKPKSTAAWVWANTPEDQKQQVIEKFEHQFGIILKEKLKMNE